MSVSNPYETTVEVQYFKLHTFSWEVARQNILKHCEEEVYVLVFLYPIVNTFILTF
jgi:hypothetical protein